MTIAAQPQTTTDTPGGDAPPPTAGQPAGAPPPLGLRDMGGRPAVPAPAAGTPAAPSQQVVAQRQPGQPTLAANLPPDTLAARLERQKRAVLRELNIDDPVAFKKQREAELAELARLKEQEEAGKRAQMSEIQRLQADLDAEKALRLAAESKAAELEEHRIANEQEHVVRSGALKHVDPAMYDYARVDFQRHVRDLERRDPKRLASMTEDDIERFFKDLVKKNPRLAPLPPTGAPAPKVEAKLSPRPAAARPALPSRTTTRPSTIDRRAGSPPIRQAPPPAAAPSPTNGKTPLPGRANSMNRQELEQHLKSQGRRPW